MFKQYLDLFNGSILFNVYIVCVSNIPFISKKLSLVPTSLKDNLFNQFFLFQSGSNLGKNAKLNVATQLRQLSFKYKTKCKLNSFTGNDIIYLYS